jgi:hypothetical protein
MKHSSHSLLRLAACMVAGLATLASLARAQTAGQTVTLAAGWNAVWLEVEPVYPPGDPKAGRPVLFPTP